MKKEVFIVIIVTLALGIYLGFSTIKFTGNYFWDDWFGNQDEFSTFGGTATNGSIVYQCGTITGAGSYTLNQSINASGVSGACLSITADNVVLDGMGFDLFGNDTAGALGISAIGKSNATLMNFANISDFNYGISFSETNNSLIKNLGFNSNLDSGIYLNLSSRCNLTNITSNNNLGEGILLRESSNNQIADATAISNSGGIYLTSNSNNNNVIRATANSNSDTGIYTGSNSNGNQLTNIASNENSVDGIYISSSTGSILTTIFVNNNSRYGLWIDVSSNNNIMGITSNNNSNLGVYILSSSDNTLANGIISLSGANDSYLKLNSLNNSFVNMSYNKSREYVESGSELFRKWHLDATSNVANTNISWTNGNITDSALSPARFELTEYYYNGTDRIYYSNYAVSASKSGYTSSGSQSVNMSENKIVSFTMTCSANCGGGGDGGSGGGGGGGGGGASTTGFWTNVYTANAEQFGNGYSKEIGKGERIKFLVGGIEHYAGIISLTSTQATINVSSKPQQAVFSIGDENKFDVTGDGNYDLSVKLNYISNNKAGVLIKSVSGVISDNSNLENNQTGNVNLANNNNISGSNWRIYVIILIILVLAIAIALYFVYRWKRSRAIESLKSDISQ